MLTTFILTLVMCLLLFLMICPAAYFLPWKGLMDFSQRTSKKRRSIISRHSKQLRPSAGYA